VAREIRATVLKKGIIIVNPIVNGFEKEVTNMWDTNQGLRIDAEC